MEKWIRKVPQVKATMALIQSKLFWGRDCTKAKLVLLMVMENVKNIMQQKCDNDPFVEEHA